MAAMTATAPAAAPIRVTYRGPVVVWMMSLATVAVTVALCDSLRGTSSLAGIAVPWWALAPLFYITERHLVRVHFRRHEHSFSLGEIPLVLGLFFLAPVELVGAQLVGSLAALVLHREEKLMKAVFNLAHFCLEATLACVIFRLLLGLDGPMGPMGRAAALVAVASTTVAGAVAVWLAIAATGGAPRWRRFVQLLGFGIAVAVMNGSFGLLAVSVLWSSPESAWLLIVPGAMTFFAYRLYTSEREKKVGLEFLYRSTRTMQRSSDSELDLVALLSSIRDMFGTERAEMVLLPVASGGRLRRTALGSGRETPVVEELDGDVTETLGRGLLEGHSVVIEPAGKGGPVDHVWGRDLTRAMIVPLAGEKGVIGGLLVGDEETDAKAFDAADLTLFETLANHVGASLERAGLSATLQRSEERFRSLVQNSSDVITVIDPDTTIKYQTPSIERVLGYEPAAMIGTKLIDLVHPEDAARVAALCRRTTSSYAANSVVEWRMRRRDGSYVYAETISSDLLENDAVRGFVLTSRDVTERKVLEDQLRHQAFHDPLTDLANRALFTDRVQHALARRSGTESPAILFLDLDDFKAVNDSLGHSAGDVLLRAVGRRLRGCIRSEDTAARLGGDEFGILLDGTGGESEALEVAERILSEMALPFAVEGREVVVSASIGIAHGSSSSADASDLLRNADVAMYMAKGRGKSGCEVFDPSAHRALRDRMSLKNDLQRAVADNEFSLRYQPVLDLDTGAVSGVEALIRWERPRHGVVSPADFIPLAEETGVVVPMGAWVLEEACAQLASWRGKRPEAELSMSVNLSAHQLQHAGIVEQVESALKKTGIVPSSLTLEITESVLMDDTEKVLATLRALKSLGVQLAIDDFGTGYSSLSYLHQFPFDILKIDKAFIGRHGDGSDESPLVRAIVELARTLGLRTVAEGIETPEQLDKLQDLHCDLGQGYLFAAPLDAADAEGFLAAPSPIGQSRELQPLAS
jgi:diguanylate cyclase (GGDEF)-like protein/PAS domain S-box-containing protein